MKHDGTLLNTDNFLTIDELKAHFQANDFTTEQSSFDLAHATKDEQRLHAKVKGIFAKSWNKHQKALGGNDSMLNFSNQYPLQLLQNADADLVAGTVMQILSDGDLTERIFESMEPSIMESVSAYSESLGKTPSHLTDEEMETAVAEYANNLSGNAVATLMQTQNVPELLGAVKAYSAHEDFNDGIENNHDKIDFDRKWDHTRTKIGRLLSAEDIEPDVLERGQNMLDDGEEYSIEEQIFEQQLEEAFVATLDSTELKICHLRRLHYSQTQIAEALGYKTHSAVTKRLAKMREKFDAVARKLRGTE